MYQKYTVADVKKSSAKRLFNVISTFAGGGGSSTGYRLAGGNIIAINEFVEEAIKTYSTNFPDTKIIPGDIKKLTGKDFLETAGLKPGELDILDGSPPCSAFSVAGKREKGWAGYVKDTRNSYFDDEGNVIEEGDIEVQEGVKKYSDGKTVESIENLFLEFIRIAEEIKPKVIVAENVKGITFGEAKEKLYEFINSFEKIGYQVTYQVLNAADFGVPQGRERTLFVCIREDVCDALDLNFLNMHSTVFPNPTHTKHVTLRQAIEDVENDPNEIQELKDYVMGGFQKDWITKLPFNPTRHTKPSDKEYRDWNPKASCFNMIRPCPDLPCPTLTQRGQQKSVSGVFHYAENRKFTIKELKRIMSLPEDFVLTGNFDQQAERIGRMVAPKMMAALASSIYENVLKPYNDRQNTMR